MMIVIFMFLSGLVVFCSFRNHLLITLFSLEYLVISLFLMMFMFLLKFGFELYCLLFFLVFTVCEGTLGLGILVNIIRSHGNDYLMGMSILSW